MKKSLTQLNLNKGSVFSYLDKAGKPQPASRNGKAPNNLEPLLVSMPTDFIMIVVDGRQSDWSSGVSLKDFKTNWPSWELRKDTTWMVVVPVPWFLRARY